MREARGRSLCCGALTTAVPTRLAIPRPTVHFIVAYRATTRGRLSCDLDAEVEALLWVPVVILDRAEVTSERFFAVGGAVECGTLPVPFHLVLSQDLRAVRALAERGLLD